MYFLTPKQVISEGDGLNLQHHNKDENGVEASADEYCLSLAKASTPTASITFREDGLSLRLGNDNENFTLWSGVSILRCERGMAEPFRI